MGCALSTSVGPDISGRAGSGAAASSEGLPPSAPPAAAAPCCYKPESEAARLQAVLDCHQLDTPAERRFDGITCLLKDLLEVPVAVVGLIDDDRLYLKSAVGEARPGASHDRLHSFCDASLRAPNPRMMIVPDTLEDARFKHNEFTKIGIRSYMGAPLISSEGHVMGSLGVMDTKPRAFPPSALNILCNFAELVVRELERDKALERQRQQELATIQTKTVRALSCFNDAVCFCDASEEGWPVLWANDKWDGLTGRRGSEGGGPQAGSRLWDCFPGVHAEVQRQASQAAHFRQPLSIMAPGPSSGKQLALELRPASRDHLSMVAPTIAVPNFVEGLDPTARPALDRLYFVVARSAATISPFKAPTAVSPTMAAVAPSPFKAPLGLGPAGGAANGSAGAGTGSANNSANLDLIPGSPPSIARDHPARGMLSAGSAASSHTAGSTTSSTRLLSSFGLCPPVALVGLRLGPKLGSGSYGQVYRATLGSNTVAVKIIDTCVEPGVAKPTRAMLEALLSQKLQHPCIVRTLTFAWEENSQDPLDWGDDAGWGHSRLSAATDPASTCSLDSPLLTESDDGQCMPLAGHQIQQMWIVQEYCDHGTLGDAIDRGWLRVRRDPDSPINLRAVLLTAQEIARALSYLHSQDIIHSDLTPNNVLLLRRPPPPGDPRPFCAKVSDFGLARTMEADAMKTVTCGCITHMPLELISGQLLSKAVDSYSWGVCMYEMLSGERAWAGRHSAQILYAITTQHQKLHVPAGYPAELRDLVEACLQDDHTQRPSFPAIEARLAALLETHA